MKNISLKILSIAFSISFTLATAILFFLLLWIVSAFIVAIPAAILSIDAIFLMNCAAFVCAPLALYAAIRFVRNY